jgi:hypothetical protein
MNRCDAVSEHCSNFSETDANNSDETARVLWTGGSWLKGQDSDAADFFYKALVRRNRKKEFGAEADHIRWFPKLDDDGKIIHRTANKADSSSENR